MIDKRKIGLVVIWGGVASVVVLLELGAAAAGRAPAVIDAVEAAVPAPRTARVDKVHIKAGDAVSAGQLLCALDTSEVDLLIAEAEAELDRLRSEVVARELDVRGADFQSGARLEQEAEQAAVALAELVTEDKRDRAELAALEEQVAKQRELVEKKLVPAEQRDELELRRRAVAERVATAPGRIAAARRHEEAARKRLAAWRAQKGDSSEARSEPERAAARAAEERLRALKAQREALTLKAPFAGRMGQVNVVEGGLVRAGDPAVTVIDDRAIAATAWVDEDGAGRVRVGDLVTLHPTNGVGSERRGRVRALGAAVIEVPPRLRVVPGEVSFGRAVYIDLEPMDEKPLPGQAFSAAFLRGGE